MADIYDHIGEDLGKSTSYAYYVAEGGTKTPKQYGEMLVNIDNVATRAEEAAGQAAESASSADQSKASAEASAASAAASQSASAASATRAENKAGEAEQSANTASEKEQSASIDAETARRMAEQAAASAGTAAGHAANAKSDADAAALSKAGAETAKTDSEAAKDGAVAAKGDAEQAKAEAQEIVDGIQAESDQIEQNTADLLKAFPTDTASGAVASFSDGANVPVKSLIVNINPVQDGSGDPSPDNVRPISGWSEVNVKRTGKNLFNANDWDHSGVTPSDRFVVVSDNSIQITSVGYMERVNNYVFSKAMPKTFSFKTRTITTSDNSPSFMVSCHKEDGTLVSLKRISLGTSVGNEQEFTINIPSDIVSLHFGSWSYTGTVLLYDMQMEFTDATAYEPYKGESLNIPLGQTVYGGKIDVTKGELVIDRVIVDLGTLNYRYNIGNSHAFDTNVTLTPSPKNNNCICSNYKNLPSPTASGIASNDKFAAINVKDDGTQFTGNYVKGVLIVKDTTYSDVAAFKTAMSGVQLCYELATPITVQLTPHEIRSLLGDNNVWADSGDSEVEYRADTKLYIQKKIAEAISALS